MIRVHVICEGQTEEEFVRCLLVKPLQSLGVILLPSCVGKVGHKGGNVKLERLAIDVRERLLKDRQCYCTTFFDYYGLPTDFPGKTEGIFLANVADKQSLVTRGLSAWATKNLGEQSALRFIPYVQMYEFEGLLFSAPDILAEYIGTSNSIAKLQKIRSGFSTPEHINDSPNTAPSKRIETIFPAYDKPKHPLLAAIGIGLDTIRCECALFNAWVESLERLAADFSENKK